MKLELLSEPFSPTGSATSTGIRNQLGRPKMDVLKLLVREAVQNSWDARVGAKLVHGPRRRRSPSAGIGFQVDLRRLGPASAALARSEVFTSIPQNVELDAALTPEADWLIIGDRGTTGLGGPTRADQAYGKHVPHDWVDFVLNSGQPPDKEFGGGTYGFGKGSFFVASEASSIVIYSRCRHGRRLESRFIASALGKPYDARHGRAKTNRPFTGRHWWGLRRRGAIEPALGSDADALAGGLGLPPFEDDELGTTIAVLSPRLDGRSREQAVNYLLGCILWNFWPKMLRRPDGLCDIEFAVSLDGASLPVPDPETVPPFSAFAGALRGIDGSGGVAAVHPIRLKSPARRLGTLGIRQMIRADPERLDEGDERSADFEGPAHHVALLRVPRLVVKYVEGPELQDEAVEYGAVFLVEDDPQIDALFAKSEPPTHDDWEPKTLPEHERKYVNVALGRVRDHLADLVTPVPAAGKETEHPSVAAIANRLGKVLLDTPAAGGSRPTRRSGTGVPPRPAISLSDRPKLCLDGNRVVAEYEIEITRPGTSGSLLTAEVAAAIVNGEMEIEPPNRAEGPALRGWRFAGRKRLVTGTSVAVPTGRPAPSAIVVTYPRNTAVALRVEIGELPVEAADR